MNNKQRSERAYRALLAYYRDSGDVEEQITDILTDLHHLAPEYGVDLDDRMDWARTHYQKEVEGGKGRAADHLHDED